MERGRSPRGSVDWNTPEKKNVKLVRPSLPSWERGLKSHDLVEIIEEGRRSPRGSVDWNIFVHIFNLFQRRRSPRGSVDWNYFAHVYIYKYFVAPLVGAWIEIQVENIIVTQINRRSPRGSVDWNVVIVARGSLKFCRSPRGSVDWNIDGLMSLWNGHVAPLVGAWIEITLTEEERKEISSLPSWGRGLKYSVPGLDRM